MTADYLFPASLGFDTRKRLLVLVGPVGSGKSTIVNLLKKGMEEYSHTKAGALYGIKGCPMHEEPLRLLPTDLRMKFFKGSRVMVEGDLCPVCQMMLKEVYQGKVEDVIVERVVISEKDRCGIGTISPSDPKSQDIAELIGSLDFSAIGKYGSESDPRAYRFDGEICIANRGILEFQELFKFDERFLYNLLNLCQEGNFKIGRYALISADEVVVAHSNEEEFRRFLDNGSNEALLSRMMVIPVPYTLRVSQEIKVLDKLLTKGSYSRHLAPGTLDAIASFMVLTRFSPDLKQGVGLLKRLEQYEAGGDAVSEVEPLERLPHGMSGIDPRFVFDTLAAAYTSPGSACLDGLIALEALEKAIINSLAIAIQTKKNYYRLLDLARQRYLRLIAYQIRKATSKLTRDLTKNAFDEYLTNIALVHQKKVADWKHMEGLEKYLCLNNNEIQAFREELALGISPGKGLAFSPHNMLGEAAEKMVFSTFKKSCLQKDVSRVIIKALVADFNYCTKCAQKALSYFCEL